MTWLAAKLELDEFGRIIDVRPDLAVDRLRSRTRAAFRSGRERTRPRPELGDVLNGRLVAAPPYTHPTLRQLYVLLQCQACGAFARTSDTNARRYGCRCGAHERERERWRVKAAKQRELLRGATRAGGNVSQAGIRPRNHPKQVRTRQSALDAVDDRRTPRSLFDALHERFAFTLDAAASADNALLPRFYDVVSDGLKGPWLRETVWCNPPFSNIPAWVAKAFAEVEDGCYGAVLLLPADRTEQAWWQDRIEPVRDRGRGVTTEFIRRRVKFGLPPGHPQGDAGLANGKSGGGYRYPPFGCVLLRLGGRS